MPKAVIVYNNTMHSEFLMSPSKFLITKSHKLDNVIPLDKKFKDTWRLGHPKFIPFREGQFVLKRIHHKGSLNVNKLKPNYDGPFEVSNLNANNLTYEIW